MKKTLFTFIVLGVSVLSACSTPKKYDVTFYANGGVFGSTSDDTIVVSTTEGELVNFEDTITKAGHTFDGWFTSTTFETEWNLETDVVTEDLDLYAKWNVNSYRVTLNNEDESKGSISGEGIYEYNSSVTVTATANSGYSFAGWYSNETLISNVSTYTFTMGAEDITLLAKWDVNSYDVALINHNPDKGSITGAGTYLYGSVVNISATPFSGNNFVGWFDEADELVSNESEYSFTLGANDVTYYAKFEAAVCNLTIELADDRAATYNGDESGLYIYGETVNLSVNNLLNKYTFVGWYDGEGNLLSSNASYSLTVPSAPTFKVIGEFSYDFSDFTIEALSTTNNFKVTKYLGSDSEIILGGAYYENGVKHTLTSINGAHSSNTVFFGSTLETISIPASVTDINYTFLGCSGVKHIHFDGNLYISGSTYNNLPNLERITVGKKSKYYIEEYKDYNAVFDLRSNGALWLMLGCKNTIIPDTVTYIASYSFYNKNIETLRLPSSLTSIGSNAFHECEKLTTVITENNENRVEIGNSAFWGCDNLKEVTLPKHTSCIRTHVFERCEALEKIYLGESALPSSNSAQLIGDYAFAYCPSLTKIIIPTGFERICQYAFYDSYNISYVFIPITVTIIESNNAFMVDYYEHLNNFVFFVEAESLPPGWPSNFNIYFGRVYYGSKPDYD